MRATVPSILCVAALAWADERVEPLLLELSAALEDGNAARCLGHIDKDRCPNYAALETNVVALTAQYEVGSSVGVIGQKQDGPAVELTLDWLLRLRPVSGGPTRERKARVRCRLEPRGKRWKVAALEPVSFFSAIEGR